MIQLLWKAGFYFQSCHLNVSFRESGRIVIARTVLSDHVLSLEEWGLVARCGNTYLIPAPVSQNSARRRSVGLVREEGQTCTHMSLLSACRMEVVRRSFSACSIHCSSLRISFVCSQFTAPHALC